MWAALCLSLADRETAIGRMINAYLTNTADLDDHAIHLLFSANRWEKSAAITKLLHEGVTVVVDRWANQCALGVFD